MAERRRVLWTPCRRSPIRVPVQAESLVIDSELSCEKFSQRRSDRGSALFEFALVIFIGV